MSEHLIVDAGSMLFYMACWPRYQGTRSVSTLIESRKITLPEAQDALVEAMFRALSWIPADNMQIEMVFRKTTLGDRPYYKLATRRMYSEGKAYSRSMRLTFAPDAVEFFLQLFQHRDYGPDDEVFIMTKDDDLVARLLQIIKALPNSPGPVVCIMRPKDESYTDFSPIPSIINVSAVRRRQRLLYV